MGGLTKQIREWFMRVEGVLSKRKIVSVELCNCGAVREVREWESVVAFLANQEVEEEAVKLGALDRLARPPACEALDPEKRLAALVAERELLLQSAKHLVGTALELSIMISALEEGLPPPKRAKVHRKQIEKHVAELEAMCKRQRPEMRIVDGFSAV